MTEDQSHEIEQALAATGTGGNGSSKIAEALGQLLKPVNRAIDELFGRVESLEDERDTLRQHIDERFDQHNALVTTRLDAFAAVLEKADPAQTESMARDIENLRMQFTSFNSADAHRRERFDRIDEAFTKMEHAAEANKKRQIAARQAAEAAALQAERTRRETLGSLGRLTLVVLPILINQMVNGTDVPRVVKQGTTVAMGVCLAVFLFYAGWTYLHRPPPLPLPAPSDVEGGEDTP